MCISVGETSAPVPLDAPQSLATTPLVSHGTVTGAGDTTPSSEGCVDCRALLPTTGGDADANEDWRRILADCKAQGQPYTDTAFPADESSMGASRRTPPGLRLPDSWRRISEFAKSTAALLTGAVGVSELPDSRIGGRHFLAACAYIARSPKVLAGLFPEEQQVNEEGVYAVQLWVGGRRRIIVVDDWLPCDAQGELLGASAEAGYWVPIVEKAWAKANGGWHMVRGSLLPEVVHGLTGTQMY